MNQGGDSCFSPFNVQDVIEDMHIALMQFFCALYDLFFCPDPNNLYPVELIDPFNPMNSAALIPVGSS